MFQDGIGKSPVKGFVRQTADSSLRTDCQTEVKSTDRRGIQFTDSDFAEPGTWSNSESIPCRPYIEQRIPPVAYIEKTLSLSRRQALVDDPRTTTQFEWNSQDLRMR